MHSSCLWRVSEQGFIALLNAFISTKHSERMLTLMQSERHSQVGNVAHHGVPGNGV